MPRRWILDTETKGTGAEMRPVEDVKKVPPGHSVIIAPDLPKPEKPPPPRGPRRFRVVDVMTRQVLAEDASAIETVDLLRDIRSIVDVSVYVWEEQAGKWQQLTHREQRMLWDRSRGAASR